MRVLITGGTGFIGSQLARRLLASGSEVRLLSLVTTPAEEANAHDIVAQGAELIEGSVTDRTLYDRALAGADVVHHIAATMREANVPDRTFWETNVEATQDLARASLSHGVRRFVYCGTMGVTGAVRGRTVDETAPYQPKDIYTRTKAAAERWILEQAREHELPATVVRPADVYGPRDQRLLKLFQMIQKGTFFYLGDGRGRRHMIYIDDLLDGMIAAQELDAALGEVFYLAGAAPVPLRELADEIARQLEVRPPRLKLPYRPVWLASAVVEGICRPLGMQPPIYPRRVEFYAHDYEFDISKARAMLGFEPKVDVPEGVRRTIAAYREEGVLA
jgi:nucleoside-diphosphate-sugar epimerase